MEEIKGLISHISLAAVGLAVVVFIAFSLLRRWHHLRSGVHSPPAFGHRARLVILAGVLLLTASFAAFPVRLPETIGVLGVIALFFSCLALVTGQLNVWAVRAKVPIIGPVIGAALAFSAFDLNDNHDIRRIKTAGAPPPDVANLPRAESEFLAWFKSRKDVQDYAGRRYPVYIVAAEGGGMYAAAHVLTFLTTAQDNCPKFSQHVFAVSSVSGGSVGASMFASLISKLGKNEPQTCTPLETVLKERTEETKLNRRTYDLLSQDYLAPLVGASLFPDFLQRFIPFPIPTFSRARAIETAFEDAWNKPRAWNVTARGKREDLPGENPLAQGFLKLWSPTGATPALLINTTEVGSGRRRVIAPFTFGKSGSDMQFLAISRDNDVPVSTAASLSARFPWLTPAGWITETNLAGQQQKIRLVDGGYFENSGVATAVDLIVDLQAVIEREKLPIDIHLISLTNEDFPVQTFFGFGEPLAPIQSMMATQATRSIVTTANAELYLEAIDRAGVRGLEDRPIRGKALRRVRVSDHLYQLPLGWRLSRITAIDIDEQAGALGNCVPDDRFENASDAGFDGDCAQRLIYHELNGDDPVVVRHSLPRREMLTPKTLCNYKDRLKSSAFETRPTSYRFINNTDKPVATNWIDFKGELKPYAVINPGETVNQPTYFTHPWVINDASGNCLGVYLPQFDGRPIHIQ